MPSVSFFMASFSYVYGVVMDLLLDLRVFRLGWLAVVILSGILLGYSMSSLCERVCTLEHYCVGRVILTFKILGRMNAFIGEVNTLIRHQFPSKSVRFPLCFIVDVNGTATFFH